MVNQWCLIMVKSMVLNNGESMVLNSLMQTNQWCDSSHTISTYFLPKLNVVIDFIISPFITHTEVILKMP